MADAAQYGFQPQPQSSWFGRHYKSVIAFGCLGLILLIAAVAASVLLLVVGGMRSSDAYKQALAKARSSPDVAARMGQPIEAGWFVSGSINVAGPTGDADLAIPISGPKGKGTLYVVAKKSAGQWTFSRMEVEIDGQPGRIDLLAPTVQ